MVIHFCTWHFSHLLPPAPCWDSVTPWFCSTNNSNPLLYVLMRNFFVKHWNVFELISATFTLPIVCFWRSNLTDVCHELFMTRFHWRTMNSYDYFSTRLKNAQFWGKKMFFFIFPENWIGTITRWQKNEWNELLTIVAER